MKKALGIVPGAFFLDLPDHNSFVLLLTFPELKDY
jgi:hypothetical protein